MNLDSVAPMSRIDIKGERLCQEILSGSKPAWITVKSEISSESHPQYPTILFWRKPVTACILPYFSLGGFIAIEQLFNVNSFNAQHELCQPEVAWSGAAEYQRLSDGGDVRHPLEQIAFVLFVFGAKGSNGDDYAYEFSWNFLLTLTCSRPKLGDCFCQVLYHGTRSGNTCKSHQLIVLITTMFSFTVTLLQRLEFKLSSTQKQTTLCCISIWTSVLISIVTSRSIRSWNATSDRWAEPEIGRRKADRFHPDEYRKHYGDLLVSYISCIHVFAYGVKTAPVVIAIFTFRTVALAHMVDATSWTVVVALAHRGGGGGGGDDNVRCTCTHGWCYVLNCSCCTCTQGGWGGGGGMITFVALAHMVDATSLTLVVALAHMVDATSLTLVVALAHMVDATSLTLVVALAHMVDATSWTVVVALAHRGGGGGGMITFVALAHMVDATSLTLVVALAHMVDATSLTLVVALAHMVDATSLTLVVALAHMVDATSLTLVVALAHMVDATSLTLVVALAHMVDATSLTLVVALAHMVDATSLTLVVALAHMVDATSLSLVVALAHMVDATSLTLVVALAHMVDATSWTVVVALAHRGGGGGGMITFVALAHMVDATSLTLVVALAHMVDATSLTLVVALAHMVDATSLTLVVALAHMVDATSLTLVVALAHMVDATSLTLVVALAHMVDAHMLLFRCISKTHCNCTIQTNFSNKTKIISLILSCKIQWIVLCSKFFHMPLST